MKETMQRLQSLACDNEQEGLALLSTIVNINSGTDNKQGVDQVGKILRNCFKDLKFIEKIYPQKDAGDNILLLNKAAFNNGGRGGVLLNSHLDTVFKADQSPILFSQNNGIIRGHGAADDKGGAVIIHQAVKLLEKLELLDKIPIRILFNTDEETGSSKSKDLIIAETSSADLVFVCEYGKPRNKGAAAVTQRLGRGAAEVYLEGDYSEGAMLEIMEKACYLAKVDESKAIRFRDYNADPKKASVKILFGFTHQDEEEPMKIQIENSVKKAALDYNVKMSISTSTRRPPMVFSQNRWRHFRKAQQIAEHIDFNIYPEVRVSGSDACFVPKQVPVLDGMGPIGDNVHTKKEFMTCSSLTIRPAIIAGLIVSEFS